MLKLVRNFASTTKKVNLTLVGAGGGIGQPLSLLLKNCKYLNKLSLYDVNDIAGQVVDLSHIDSSVCVRKCEECLEGADVVVMVGGIGRKPGMSRDDLFECNAKIVLDLSEKIVAFCPKAFIVMVTNPVNSLVPVVSEVFKKCNENPKRIFGMMTLDVVRARTFLGQKLNIEPELVKIPVVGGHSEKTTIPLYSRAIPSTEFRLSDLMDMTKRVQMGGSEVVNAKKGEGSAILATAHAVSQFVTSLCKAINGEEITECTYVASTVTEAEFFSTPVLLGPQGVKQNHGLGKISEFESKQVCEAIEELKKDIKKGVKFVRESKTH